MLHPTLRELRALPPDRPPRGLAFVMGLTTASILIAGTLALAFAARPERGGETEAQLRRVQEEFMTSRSGPCLGPR